MTSAPVEVAPEPYSSGSVLAEGLETAGRFGVATTSPSWRGDYPGADIIVTADGAETANNALYAVVADPGYPSCRVASYTVQSLSWDQVPSGTTVCIQTKDKRVGTVKFVWSRDREGNVRDRTVSGVIWAPKR
ncbi:hypothetical protein BJY24_006422 [Nocardia transvalensis]|uniref:Uncharacterized protein n=1 Tax=Nocardia transvalensis TaxID=37333 RepID=A0A7W9PJY6_9NOCA|nr:hypothetical protein [Nocardia transvalensis]MBB5917510.1 hypothetical protein [Nocardia transvalensis]